MVSFLTLYPLVLHSVTTLQPISLSNVTLTHFLSKTKLKTDQTLLSPKTHSHPHEVDLLICLKIISLSISIIMIKSRTSELKDVPQNQQLALRGLALRLGQCGFAAAVIGVMVTSLGFSSFTAYWYFLIFSLLFGLFLFF